MYRRIFQGLLWVYQVKWVRCLLKIQHRYDVHADERSADGKSNTLITLE